MQAYATPHPATASALPMLLARYVNGEIADRFWRRLMRTFDADEITTEERLALARFVNDLLSERGPRVVNIPRLEETTALLLATRAA